MSEIYGIGSDIVGVARMVKAVERRGDKLAGRVLAPAEWEVYRPLRTENPRAASSFLAKRFAAKEAAVKAMGTGFRDGITLNSIEVSNNSLGAPQLRFSGMAAEFCRRHGITKALISLADEREYAVAFVTLLCDPKSKPSEAVTRNKV